MKGGTGQSAGGGVCVRHVCKNTRKIKEVFVIINLKRRINMNEQTVDILWNIFILLWGFELGRRIRRLQNELKAKKRNVY